jgi:hypothetical protein
MMCYAMQFCFDHYQKILLVSDDFPPDTDIFDRHDLIVVLKNASSNVAIEEHVKEGWELQFIGSSPMEIVDLGKDNGWKGHVHMRYGGKNIVIGGNWTELQRMQ